MPLSTSLSRADAIARYTEVAFRLPTAKNSDQTQYVEHLGELVDQIDAFVLDGFGVLNVGEETIPGAIERVASLQAMGKRVLVLTNGATLPVEKTVEKYARWGMQFELADVISSRNALEVGLQQENQRILWGVVGSELAQVEKLAPRTVLLGDNADDYARADGFVFLSAMDWSDGRQNLLREALSKQERPVLVGNPDLVAPREDAMSLEPGLFVHELADAGLCNPQFFGKPFKNVFDLAAKRISNIEPHRIAMVGDTLHTDILGGSNYGWQTVLIKSHGLMKEADVEKTVEATGIRPDFVSFTT